MLENAGLTNGTVAEGIRRRLRVRITPLGSPVRVKVGRNEPLLSQTPAGRGPGGTPWESQPEGCTRFPGPIVSKVGRGLRRLSDVHGCCGPSCRLCARQGTKVPRSKPRLGDRSFQIARPQPGWFGVCRASHRVRVSRRKGVASSWTVKKLASCWSTSSWPTPIWWATVRATAYTA